MSKNEKASYELFRTIDLDHEDAILLKKIKNRTHSDLKFASKFNDYIQRLDCGNKTDSALILESELGAELGITHEDFSKSIAHIQKIIIEWFMCLPIDE